MLQAQDDRAAAKTAMEEATAIREKEAAAFAAEKAEYEANIAALTKAPEGTKRATSVNVRLLRLRKDLRTGSLSQDVANFPSELCKRRSDWRVRGSRTSGAP